MQASIHAISTLQCPGRMEGEVLAIVSGSAKIVTCSFNNNSGTNAGVFYASLKSKLTITCSSFTNNTAASIGGVLHQQEGSSFTVIDCLFLSNIAK